MKLKGEVLKVETTGDFLEIELQTEVIGQAFWRPMGDLKFAIPDMEVNRKTFHVGRKVIFDVKPK
jgi:hypothetical protein